VSLNYGRLFAAVGGLLAFLLNAFSFAQFLFSNLVFDVEFI
jgi:hypothetical protein